MKLRIKGDSLRLRLTQGEVTRLAEQGEVQDRVRFAPDQALVYRIRRDAETPQILARFDRGAIEVRIPEAAARAWCGSDEVGISAQQPLDDGELRILIEKDFACLKPRQDEDESDNFPHPAGADAKC